jgi:hypothetical protein
MAFSSRTQATLASVGWILVLGLTLARAVEGADPTKSPPKENGTLSNVDDCLYLYQEGGSATVNLYNVVTGKDNTQELKFAERFDFKILKDPASATGKCINNTLNNGTGTLVLEYNKFDESNITGMQVTFDFEKLGHRGYWWVKQAMVKLSIVRSGRTENKEFQLDTYDIMTASTGFSFSCNSLSVRSLKPTVNVTHQMTLRYHRFQTQPFNNTRNPIFADSFDCSTWFTLPLWMGLFVMILFTAIMALGIYLLFEIKTMDRFENPKGKTITVPLGD